MKIQCVNKKYLFLLVALFGTFITVVKAQSISPFYYWTFNGKEAGKDMIRSRELNARSYQCSYTIIDGKSDNAIDMSNADCLVVTSAMKPNVTDEFSVEFFFKGANFTFLTFSQQFLIIQFGYPRFLFRTTVLSSEGKSQTDNFWVELKGAGKQAYNYYTGDSWHHLVFTASLKTEKKEIWVDGECPEGFSKSIQKGKHFEFGNNDGFRNTDQIDELAFYNMVIPSELVRQHFEEANSSKSYSFSINKKYTASARKTTQPIQGIDTLEFAPGYPDYAMQAIDQLKSFPLPRYNAAVPVKRNMSWMDITYLHRELSGKGGGGFGKENPQKAVELSEEMAKYWNYYVDVPTLRTTAEVAAKQYGNKNGVHGALIDFANHNPQYPVASILIESQGRPIHAGYESSKAYVTAQDLPATYYLKDKRNVPVVHDKKKWFSPLMPLDIIQKDGRTSRFYLNQLLKHLDHPPALINENGEVFGHIRKEALLKQDPAVWEHYRRSGLTESQYSGWFQNRLDSVYRAIVMHEFDSVNTHFSFYNVSAFNAGYWPDYVMRRELNRWDKETVYPTPDFYPRWPDNWQNAKGAFNGYGTVAKGRATEIALDDRFFTPFVSAGWGKEEDNIRPAQWLALLKAMTMLGADFFYVGYFNVTGAGGKWPNGAGPNDPRGYAYQIAMPAYAQAVKTWVPEFFSKGELLNPADPGDLVRQFRFKGSAENELILVRKLDKQYLIYGSIQPNSNIKGNVPRSKQTTINLEGNAVSFEIRRQGSTYILDNSGAVPIFYQLDGWHQYEYPSYWNKGYWIEAELLRFKENEISPLTEFVNGISDFVNCLTFISVPSGNQASSTLILRGFKKYRIVVRGRSDGGVLKISLGKTAVDLKVEGKEWKEFSSGIISFSKEEVNSDVNLTLSSLEKEVDIDWIKLEPVE